MSEDDNMNIRINTDSLHVITWIYTDPIHLVIGLIWLTYHNHLQLYNQHALHIRKIPYNLVLQIAVVYMLSFLVLKNSGYDHWVENCKIISTALSAI